MYIEFDENTVIEDGKYLCVSKLFDTDKHCYSILNYYNKPTKDGICRYDFDGKGFYDFDVEYGYYRVGIIAYQPVEEFIQQIKEITNEQ